MDARASIDPEALDLFGQIVSANAAAAARTSNDLVSHWAGRAAEMARLYLALVGEVDKAAQVVTTRQLERVIGDGWAYAQTADSIIESAEHVINLFNETVED